MIFPRNYTVTVDDLLRFSDYADEAHAISDTVHSEHEVACQNTRPRHLVCVKAIVGRPRDNVGTSLHTRFLFYGSRLPHH